MKKLTIGFSQPKIEINGVVFDILKSDGEVFDDALRLSAKYADLDIKNADACIAAARNISGYVDRLLGKGALKRMNGGREPGLMDAMNAMMLISAECASSYVEKLAEYE